MFASSCFCNRIGRPSGTGSTVCRAAWPQWPHWGEQSRRGGLERKTNKETEAGKGKLRRGSKARKRKGKRVGVDAEG